jgi:hypothetical protein
MLDSANKNTFVPYDLRKREKFIKSAERRTRNAIVALRLVAKLSNRNSYEFTQADVDKIVKALSREIEFVKSQMSSSAGSISSNFTL